MAARSRSATVRMAHPSDAAALARLEHRAFRGYYAAHRFSAAQFRSYLARPTTIAHVVDHGGEITAYALGIRNTASRRHIARLYSIAVDGRQRDRRLGARLLRAFVAEADRRGCRVVYLEVAARNAPAIALFARHGFVPTARLRAFYARTVDGIRMRRELRRSAGC